MEQESLVYRLRKRAEIRRGDTSRRSVREGKRDSISDLLEEAARELDFPETEAFSPLKTCPFCGGEAELYIESPPPEGDMAVHYIYCIKCMAKGAYAFCPEEALSYWNVRN